MICQINFNDRKAINNQKEKQTKAATKTQAETDEQVAFYSSPIADCPIIDVVVVFVIAVMVVVLVDVVALWDKTRAL